MTDETCLYWVVICKNHRFHSVQNPFFGHKILLAETDAYSPMPALDNRFTVRCDDCGREYSYKVKEVRRLESEYMDDLKPHPLFVSFRWLFGPESPSPSEAAAPPIAVASHPEQSKTSFLQHLLKSMQEGRVRLEVTLGRGMQRLLHMLAWR